MHIHVLHCTVYSYQMQVRDCQFQTRMVWSSEALITQGYSYRTIYQAILNCESVRHACRQKLRDLESLGPCSSISSVARNATTGPKAF